MEVGLPGVPSGDRGNWEESGRLSLYANETGDERVVQAFFGNDVIFPESRRPLIFVYSYTRIKKQIP